VTYNQRKKATEHATNNNSRAQLCDRSTLVLALWTLDVVTGVGACAGLVAIGVVAFGVVTAAFDDVAVFAPGMVSPTPPPPAPPFPPVVLALTPAASTSPTLVQNPDNPEISEKSLGSAVCQYFEHEETGPSKPCGFQDALL